jgi:cytoskeletal protein RodZ
MTARHAAPSLGLAECRKSKGISLSQISEATKISRRYLEAIEQGEFKALPGGVIGVNYVRQYARASGYDEQDLVAIYRKLAPPEPLEPTPQAPDAWSCRLRDSLSWLFPVRTP